jgi:sec-independent protein translocase protein TatA
MPYGLGGPELLIILLVVLVLFGGSRLAGVGRSFGQGLRAFRDEVSGPKTKPE